MKDLLKTYSVIYETPVAWGEMDALGHVNNIVYFRYFESARSDYFQKVGIWESAKEKGIGVILHSTSCRFRKPLTYPDTVSVGTRVTEIHADRFTMEYAVYSHADKSIAAEGTGIVVVYDYRKNQKCAMPAAMRKNIEELEHRLKK
ncbi:acyl-CoA thioesterase [bacterium]|nr:MAG: acyl-CoA thioesterase [bacterium]